MEKPGELEETAVDAGDNADHRTPERRTVRRRLIQSTLFPPKPPDNAQEVVEDKQEDEDSDKDEEEDEDYCGSQGKKKRKRKRKGKETPPSRASKKKDVDQQVIVDGKEALNGKVNKKNSPVSAKSNFFLKASEKRLQKKQPKEQLCDNSPEGNNKTCLPSKSVANMRSPKKLKEKRKVNTTPTKNVTNNGLKGSCLRQISTSPISGEQASQPIPDLRLEAKLTAEENSRLFAGKQIHPFFSSLKSSKKYQETSEVDSWCSVERKDRSVATLGPVHVFEALQDEVQSLDWKNWMISERTFSNSDSAPKLAFSSIFEGSVESLNIDNFLRPSHLSNASFSEKAFMDQFSSEAQSLPARTGSAILANEQGVCYRLLKDTEVIHLDHKVYNAVMFPGHDASHVENLDDEQDSRISQERLAPYYLGSCSLPKDILWTEKYQPEKAVEVCGNSESVKFLNEWLHLWHERDFRTSKGSGYGDKCNAPYVDHDYYDSDCDSENIDEGASLKNVLLITGPVGSGKSAAIYACAKEQGFKVIEVNTSDWRNGALVKQNFKEAVESHRLKWSLRNHVDSQSKRLRDDSPAVPYGEAPPGFDNEVIELIPLSDEDESRDAITTPVEANQTACDRGEIKSLVLFEDVDITFIEDRGFIAAIQHLAETAKLPMILTTNSNGPVLPENMDRLEVFFTMPTLKELLSHVHMVCAAEKANINNPHLIERFVEYFHGDIRKTITHLQFWCQGKRSTKDWRVQRKYGPLLFDLVAGHQILPKMIPWDFPSQLSELVENEITKSLSIIEENSTSIEKVEEEDLEGMQNGLEMNKNETGSTQAKKEAILSRNFSDYDCNEFQTHIGNSCDLSDSSGSPVAFTRRNVRRKLDKVQSFSSDDELYGDPFHVLSVKETNEVFLDIDCNVPPPAENCLNPITAQLLHCAIPPISSAAQNCFTPLTDQLLHCAIPPISSAAPNCFTPLTDQLLHCAIPPISSAAQNCFTPLTDQLLHCAIPPISSAALNCFTPLPDQLLYCAIPPISSAALNCFTPLPDQLLHCAIPPISSAAQNCFTPLTDQLLHCAIPPISSAAQSCFTSLPDQLFQSEGEKLQESYYQCSATAADLYVNGTCRSVDISSVPESSFVPETELNDGTELISYCHHVPDSQEAVSVSNELIENLSPIQAESIIKPLSRLRKGSRTIQNSFDANVESIHGEEVGDSQNEHVEAVTRGYQVMDECSRMNFNKKTESFEKPESCVVSDSVQETWRKLRGRHTDLRQYVTSEQKQAAEIVKLAFKTSNLFSDADMLLSNCNFFSRDSLEPSMVASDESDTSGWYNEQLQMTSTFAEHGFCLSARDIAATGTAMSSNSRVDLVSEMLASMTDTMAIGKLVRDEMGTSCLNTLGTSEMRPKTGVPLKRETESCLHDIVQSLVPSRSHLALKGHAFYEYLSSLGQISRSEASRLSSGMENTKRRRGRAARHYLSIGALGLSREDISLLNQYSCSGKFLFQSMNASSR